MGHWNGRTWSRAAVPHVLAARFRGQELDAYSASSNRNVWVFSATGSYLRLTGNRWQFGRLPQRIKTRHDIIAAAEVLSPTNVWVFGTHYIGSIDRLKFVPFAARFDGRTWRAVRIRGVGGMGPVSVISAANMWGLTGALVPGFGLRNQPKVVHWNGTSWSTVSPPARPSEADEFLTSLVPDGSGGLWAVAEAFP